jgi:hypothetical protein
VVDIPTSRLVRHIPFASLAIHTRLRINVFLRAPPAPYRTAVVLSKLYPQTASPSSNTHFPTRTLTLTILAILPYAFAAGTCASSGSLSWPPVGECNVPNKYPTAVQTCRACCLNDQPCFTACLKAAGIGARDTAQGETEAREVAGRAVALTCATNEGCYRYTDGSLLCLNLGTGMYFLTHVYLCHHRENGKLTMFVNRIVPR